MRRKQGRLKLNKVINDRNGFTLAELLIVVGIIVILAGISFVAASMYYKSLKLTAMDNTAKEIFIAAQNHLTSAQVSGELGRYAESDEVVDNAEGGADSLASDKKALGKIMDYKPSDVKDTDIQWPDPNQEYYYILHDTDSEIRGSVLQYALPAGAIDDYVNTDGKYIIEYDIDTASVYGVFYTEAKNTLNADTVKKLNQKNGDYVLTGRGGSDAAKKVRKNHRYDGESQIIGYYGGAMAEDWRVEESPLQLRVKNGEQLIAIIRDNNFDSTEKIVLKVHGETSGNDALVTYAFKNMAGNAITPFGRLNGDVADYNIDRGKTKGSTFGYISDLTAAESGGKNCREYQIVLDDITRGALADTGGSENHHFAYLFPTFIPGEDITLTAYAYNETGNCTGETPENTTVNSLFENAEARDVGDDVQRTAYISSFRHLENMDRNISGLQRKGNTYNYKEKYTLKGDRSLEFNDVKTVSSATVEHTYTEYVQTADMDWNGYYSDKYLCGVVKNGETVRNRSLYDWEKDLFGQGVGNAVHRGTYFSIVNSDMLEYDGGGYTIANVYIENSLTTGYYDESGDSNGALFGYISQSTSFGGSCNIHDLILEDFTVNAPKNAAALIAEYKSTKYKLNVENVLVDGGSITSVHNSGVLLDINSAGSNRGNAGALTGYAGKDIYVDGCGSTAKIETTGRGYDMDSTSTHLNAADTGGLVGEIKNVGEFRNSYTGGITGKNGNYSTRDYNIAGTYTAGGILGRASNSSVIMYNCYSTSSVYSAPTASNYSGYAGGLVGMQEKNTCRFTNSYATGLIGGVNSGGRITVKGTVLGLGTAVYSGSYYLEGVNSNLKSGGNTTSDPVGVGSMSYAAMFAKAAGQSKETYGINRGGDYPFRIVNKTGIVNSGKSGVHYGDWPSPKGAVTDLYEDLMFAYKETIGGNDYWYIVSKDSNGNYSVAKDTLPKGTNAYLDDSDDSMGKWSYGFICPKTYSHIDNAGNIESKEIKSLGVYFKNGGNNTEQVTLPTNSATQKYDKDSEVEIDGRSYAFWKFQATDNDIVTTPEQNNGNTGQRFTFNQKFAASITTAAKNDLGTEPNVYQIRSEKQLNNIKTSGYLAGKNYAQTLDIDLGLDGNYEFASIGSRSTPFTGTYTGKIPDASRPAGSDAASYTISNFAQTISGTDNLSGLFGKVSTDSTVSSSSIRNVNLAGRVVGISNPDAETADIIVSPDGTIPEDGMEIGGLISICEGNVSVTDCSADLVIKTLDTDDKRFVLPNNIVCLGGMIGSVVKKGNSNILGEVLGCSFKGRVILNASGMAGANTRLRVGAFIGRSTSVTDKNNTTGVPFAIGTENDPAELIIKLKNANPGADTYEDRIGGAIGEAQGTRTANCDIFLNMSYITDVKREAYCGGIAGYRDKNKISKCNYKGNISINSNLTKPDTVVYSSLKAGSQIGKIYGFMKDNGVFNENTYEGTIVYKGISLDNYDVNVPYVCQ
ncbi:MAG: prepilin-type N-terminal cleavage/methylation domain-containing protein [Clostridiales bacterium]|nr:prepilin-type N-terminal cleavage/methylation domain-containing protein [Clostridiales bacterium]